MAFAPRVCVALLVVSTAVCVWCAGDAGGEAGGACGGTVAGCGAGGGGWCR